MISDIPICTFMSGGLDSSLVSAISSEFLKEDGMELTTYSFDFVDNETNFVPNDFQSTKDRPFVDIMKEHIKSKHIYLECDNESQADYLYKAVDARDLPCMADVESSLLYFCSLVAKNVRVALTGECADEIFGGYPWFGKPLPKDNFPWSMDFDTRNFLLKDDIVRELNLEEYSKNVYLNCINEAPLLTSDAASEASAKKLSGQYKPKNGMAKHPLWDI